MTLRPGGPTLLATVACLALFASGCFAPTAAHIEQWRADAAAHGAMGLAAEFNLTATPYHVTGEGILDRLDAPAWIVPSLPGWTGTPPYVYIATTLGDAGVGVLRLEGAQVRITAGTLDGLKAARVEGHSASVRVLPAHDVMHTKPTINWTEAQFNVSSDLFHAQSVVLDGRGLRLDSFDRGVFYDARGQETAVTAPVTVDATALYLLPESLIVLQADTVGAAYDRFAWAGQASAGSLTTEKDIGLPRPLGVFGDDARLLLGPGRVATDGTFRLTQAVGPNGPLLEADVELHRLAPGVVNVAPGQSAWVAFDYRERGYEGAAVAKSVQITGSGAGLVEVRMERPPLLIEEMFDLIPASAPWAQPLVGFFVVLSSPAVIWLDIANEFRCLLSTCPEKYPYPAWMEPGEIGTFYIEVKGDAAPGAYTAEVTLKGANHDDIVIPLEIEVVPSTSPGP